MGWSVIGTPTKNDAKYANPTQTSPVTVAVPTGVHVGDLLVVDFQYGTVGGTDITGLACTDNATAPNGYSQTGTTNHDAGTDQGMAEFRAWVTDASATTISVSFTGQADAFLAVQCIAYRHTNGAITSDPLTGTPDKGNQAAPGTGANAITQPTGTTPAVSGALIHCALIYPGALPTTTTVGTGFTLGQDDTAGAQQATEWLEQATAANIKGTWTEGSAGQAMTIVAAFAPPAGGGADVLVRFGNVALTLGSGLITAAFLSTAVATLGGGYYLQRRLQDAMTTMDDL